MLLARDPEGVSECVNDINGELINFWHALQSVDSFHDFKRIVEAIPFSEEEWNFAHRASIFGCDTDRAVNFFVHCRQSLAGRMKNFAPLSKTRIRRGMNEQASAWLTCIEGLPAVHARLKRVVILNHDALDVIRQQDGKQTLFYIDAPYVKTTRTAPDVYAFEMTNNQHQALIDTLLSIQGKALVSMYHHPIYDALHEKHGWRLVEFNLPNNAAGGDEKRRMIECCWMNYQPSSTGS